MQERTNQTEKNNTLAYEPENHYRFNLLAKNWVATAGVMNFCHDNKCMWVLDVITSYLPNLFALARVKNVDYMLIIEVKVSKNDKAIFTISQQPDEELQILFKQNISYTTLTKNLKFWAINETTDNYNPADPTVLLLPEEY